MRKQRPERERSHRVRLRAGAIAAGTVAIVALAVAFFPWNAFRGPLAHYFSRQLDRPVSIGALDVRLGWTTHVRMENLTIGNAAWSHDPPDVSGAGSSTPEVKPFTLLAGAPRFPVLDLTQAELLLEKSSDGVPNWLFGDSKSAPDILVGTIYVDGGVVRYRDPGLHADVSVKVQAPRVPGSPPTLRFDGDGVLRREPFHIEGRGSALSALRQINDAYQLDMHARAGATSLGFAGTVVPGDVENLRGDLQLQGKDLSQLYPFVPLQFPWTPPYKLSGKLTHQDARWSYTDFRGVVGDSDLSGSAALDISQTRPLVTADLSSRRFNYKDLGGIVGIPPGDAASGVKAPEQQRESARRAASLRVLPGEPFQLGKLRVVDADIKFRGTRAWHEMTA